MWTCPEGYTRVLSWIGRVLGRLILQKRRHEVTYDRSFGRVVKFLRVNPLLWVVDAVTVTPPRVVQFRIGA